MKEQSLPKRIILKKNEHFRVVFQQGRHIHFEYFSFYFLKRDECRVGFTTKKDYKNKPTRNRMKRIVRELWRKNFRKYNLPAYIVIVAKEGILEAEHKRLEKLMNAALSKIEKKLNESHSDERGF